MRARKYFFSVRELFLSGGVYTIGRTRINGGSDDRSGEYQQAGGMLLSKSIAFAEDDLSAAAAAASLNTNVQCGEFLDLLRSGDAQAFDNLVHRYSGDVYALLYRLTENAEDAGDLTQETFLSALKSIKGFRGDADLKTWLFRIAVNHSRNRFRWWKRRRRDKTTSLDAAIGNTDLQLHETLAADGPDPEEASLRREREQALRAALRRLPQIYREAVVLCDIEGLAYDEIAVALELNIGTVKSRIARGRKELRELLKGI